MGKPAPLVTVSADMMPGEAAGYVMGSPEAKVEITEFADFECPGCGYFATMTEHDIRERLVKPGLVRFRFVDFPLDGHRHAMSAHVAAGCADMQSKFWEMHDRIFAGQNDWNATGTDNPKKVFQGYVKEIGLDAPKWEECYDSRTPMPRILANRKDGERLMVRGTPTLFVNNVMLPETPAFDRLKAIVDSIRRVDSLKAPGK